MTPQSATNSPRSPSPGGGLSARSWTSRKSLAGRLGSLSGSLRRRSTASATAGSGEAAALLLQAHEQSLLAEVEQAHVQREAAEQRATALERELATLREAFVRRDVARGAAVEAVRCAVERELVDHTECVSLLLAAQGRALQAGVVVVLAFWLALRVAGRIEASYAVAGVALAHAALSLALRPEPPRADPLRREALLPQVLLEPLAAVRGAPSPAGEPAAEPVAEPPAAVELAAAAALRVAGVAATSEAAEPAFGTPEFEEAKRRYIERRVAELSPVQMEALELMRAHFAGASCAEIDQKAGTFRMDDATLLRFLHARKFDVGDARQMLSNHLAWRELFAPGLIQPADVEVGIRSGVARLAGRTHSKEPIVLVQVSCFRPGDYDSQDDFVRTCAFFFERCIREMPPGLEKGLIWFDMAGFSLIKHWNIKSAKLILAFIKVIQDQNPERMRRLMLFNSPRAFQVAWSVIRGWLDPDVEAKISFVGDYAALQDEMDATLIMQRYGGQRTEEWPVQGADELGIAAST
jgi:hypothetical protein